MKNKRTKFTAILLSALMAVSTISSMTWAADLFGDGSTEAESIVDEPIVSDSNSEDVSAVTDETLMGSNSIALGSNDTVTFTYYANKKIEVVVKSTSGEEYTIKEGITKGAGLDKVGDYPPIIEATCTTREAAVYSVEIGNDTILSTDTTFNGAKVEVDPTYKVTVGGKYSYVVTPIDPKGHVLSPSSGSNLKEGMSYIIKPATETEPGIRVYYKGCKVCGKIVGNTTDAGIDPKKCDWSSVQDKRGKVSFNTGTSTVDVYIEEIGENGHSFTNDIKILTDLEYKYWVDFNNNGKQDSGELNQSTSSDSLDQRKSIASKYLFVEYAGNYELENGDDLANYAPFNSVYNLSTYKMEIADPDNKKDAYYYRVVKCDYCNTVRYYDKVVLKNASNEVSGDFVEEAEGGNILGFFLTGRNDKCYVFEGISADNRSKISNAGITIVDELQRINSDLIDTSRPIIDSCGKMGYYYFRKYVKDTPEAVYEELKEVPSITHVWGTVEVAPNGKAFPDKTTSETEDSKLLNVNQVTSLSYPLSKSKDGFGSDSHKVVVIRDSSGNVTAPKSINCITEAKYQLYHECIICGTVEKVGGVQITDPNTDIHNWSDWSLKPDDADSKYYQIPGEEGKNSHLKYTYLHHTCLNCGKRELKLDAEIKESHKLVETKFDDEGEDSTYVAATCGTDGSYDVILRCACGLEDDNSRKQAKIPATDQHNFGDNEPELIIVGTVQVGGRTDKYGNEIQGEEEDTKVRVVAQVARKCTVCGEYDSNGINSIVATPGEVRPEIIAIKEGSGRTFVDYVPAKVNPKTGIAYPCSAGKITVKFNWEGKVDGVPDTLTGERTVLYYPNIGAYQGAKDHQADDVRIEGKVDATTEAPGHFDRVVYCSVCGDEVSRETIEIAQIGSAPSIKAVSANYNTINVSWDAVEGADHYRLYYKSSDVGVTTWKLVRTVNGTSFTHSGLVTGAKYRYTVRAVLNGVNGEYDRKGSVAIPKLAAPENVAITAVSGKNKVSWSKVDGANGYIIQRSTGNGWTRVGSVKKGAKVTWTDKKPVSGATYRVRAYRTVNDANFSKNNVYSAFSAAK